MHSNMNMQIFIIILALEDIHNKNLINKIATNPELLTKHSLALFI